MGVRVVRLFRRSMRGRSHTCSSSRDSSWPRSGTIGEGIDSWSSRCGGRSNVWHRRCDEVDGVADRVSVARVEGLFVECCCSSLLAKDKEPEEQGDDGERSDTADYTSDNSSDICGRQLGNEAMNYAAHSSLILHCYRRYLVH